MVRRQDLHTYVRTSVLLLTMLFLLSLDGIATVFSQGAPPSTSDFWVVQTIETSDLGVPSPRGLSYSADAGALLLPSPADASQVGASTLVLTNPQGYSLGSVQLIAAMPDPLNSTFDDRGSRLVFLDTTADELVEVAANQAGLPSPGASAARRQGLASLGIREPRGMTVDPATGRLFVLDAAAPRILWIAPDSAGDLDINTARRDGRLGEVKVNGLPASKLRGIAFNPENGHLYLMLLESKGQLLYEVAQDGQIVSSRDLSAERLHDTGAMLFAPTGDSTDDPSKVDLYVADGGQPATGGRAPNGSGVIELSLEQQSLAVGAITASSPGVIDTSLWSPPSPDVAGVKYWPSQGKLIAVDSEVEEMTIWQGANVFLSSTTGELTGTCTTFPTYSKEPTDVAVDPDPSHRRIFISDDSLRRILEINYGTNATFGRDGNFCTPMVRSFSTTAFGDGDPESVAFGVINGREAIFVTDGLNKEVYRVDPGPNGIFDGVPSAGDDTVTHFDTGVIGLDDPEGIDYDPVTGHLFIVSRLAKNGMKEVTLTGSVVRTFDVSFITSPAGVGIGPGSVNPAETSAYVGARGVDNGADPNENDGKIYEIPLGGVSPTPLPTSTPTRTPTPTNTPTATPIGTPAPNPTFTPTPVPTSTGQSGTSLSKAGAFSTGTGAASTTLSVTGLGFQPKAIIFWWGGQTGSVDATGGGSSKFGMGFATAPADRRCLVTQSQDGADTSSTDWFHANTAAICILTTSGSPDGLLDLQSMDSGGFTMVVRDQFTLSYRVHYLALGGSAITAASTGNFLEPAATGNQDVTSLAFQPDFVLFASSAALSGSAPGSRGQDARMAIGACTSPTQQGVVLNGSEDSLATTSSRTYARSNECIAMFNSGAPYSINARASLAQFLPNGFRLNWLQRNNDRYIHFLAIKGGNYRVGNLTTQTDTSTPMVEDGFGFSPSAALFVSNGQAQSPAGVPQANSRWSVGAFSSLGDRGAQAALDEDNVAISEAAIGVEHDEVYLNITNADTVGGSMDVQSIDPDGFTTIMDTPDQSPAFVWYAAFGSSGGTAPAPTATPTATTPTPTATATAINTPTPTATALPTATATAATTPTSTPDATATSTAASTPTPTSAPVSSATPTPTATADATATSTPTGTAEPTPTETPAAVPTSTPTQLPLSTETPTSTPTSAPAASATPTSTALPPDPPTPTSTATAAALATSTPTVTPTITPTPVPVHVGDLDGTGADINRNFWRATVTISVHDAGDSPVAGATVGVTWSGSVSGTATCTTGGNGQCSVPSPNVRLASTSVTMSVDGVTGVGWIYTPGTNHDPDGDSNGSTITVSRSAGA